MRQMLVVITVTRADTTVCEEHLDRTPKVDATAVSESHIGLYV